MCKSRPLRMPPCRHLCCLLLSRAVSANGHRRSVAAVAAAPSEVSEFPRRRVVVNEIASGMASAGVAVCCCPLAIVYSILLLLLGCPCSLLLKFARNAKTRYQISRSRRKRRRRHGQPPGACEEEKPGAVSEPRPACEEEKATLLPLPSTGRDIFDRQFHFPSHGWKFSFGFAIVSGRRTMAFHAEIESDRLLSRVPALIRQKIGELKMKRLGSRKRKNGTGSCHRVPEERAGIESSAPSSAAGSPARERWPLPFSGKDGERGREMVASGFEHPFWQEHFEGEGRQLGFWRGLDLRDS